MEQYPTLTMPGPNMLPDQSKSPHRSTSSSDSGYDSSSENPVWEHNYAKSTRHKEIWKKITKPFHKKTATTTDPDNAVQNHYNVPSPGIVGSSHKAPGPIIPYVGTPCTAAEPEAAALDPSQSVSNRPHGDGVGGPPRSQWSQGHGGTSHTPGRTAPSRRSNNSRSSASRPAQGGYSVAPSIHHDLSPPSTGEYTTLRNNINYSNGAQVIGVALSATSTSTSADAIYKATANIHAYDNSHKGMGNQIIGQCVEEGGCPQPFGGCYENNSNHNGGDQIVGLQF